ncbi:PadR family transcriptional regulator [Microbispora bryophytorum]|uniref:PadR family transcriptional regulator n=1 Tax=Microbispora bryophytorum subsp. camponoti TaxID=1677852 RepID=A0ABR8L202_9ACTN|nr:PadR family transcriptional regulator [Microbispora camponoti]MBD3143982.1 PadR family transcriptional regulator [Microbispora camponoti]
MSLRMALLGVLSAYGSASGYDLTKGFERSVAHAWQAGHSQIYPELAKMTADGLVTVEAEGARGRKIYSITPEGRAELRAWLIGHDPTGPARSEIALQAFLLPLLDPGEALTVLERLKTYAERKLAELEALWAAKHASPVPEGTSGVRFGDLALDLGIRHTRTTLQWVNDAMAQLERRA